MRVSSVAEKQLTIAKHVVRVAIGLLCLYGIAGLINEHLWPAYSARAIDREGKFELWIYLGWFGTIGWMYISARASKGAAANTGLLLFLNAVAPLLLTILYIPKPGFLALLYLLSLINTVLLTDHPSGLTVLAASVTAHTTALLILQSAGFPLVYVVLGMTVFLFSLLIRSGIREWRRQHNLFEQAQWAAEEIAKTNTRLRENMNWRELHSRSMERIRVAREVHDTVGHTLTSVLFQISAARAVIEEDPASAVHRLDKVEEMVRGSLQEVRKEVSHLRSEAETIEGWTSRCKAMCISYADVTGIRISVEFEAGIETVPDTVGEEVFRILQEGLTNAYRHGRAGSVDVKAGVRDEILYLRISDDGIGAAKTVPGNGLTGMKERVSAFGGTVAWQTLPHKGFDIGIRIPLSEKEAG